MIKLWEIHFPPFLGFISNGLESVGDQEEVTIFSNEERPFII